MLVRIDHSDFECPVCKHRVTEVVTTTIQCVNTAQVKQLERGVGHTVALVGIRWVVRCLSDPLLSPTALTVGSDKVVRAATSAGPSQGPASPAAKRRA